MATISTTTISNNQGTVTVSGRAGRLLFALLLSSGTSVNELSMLANVPKKLLPACVDELTLALETQEQSPDPNAVGAKEANSLEEIIAHNNTNVSGKKYLDPVDPEDVVLAACKAADLAANPKAQALAVVEAWRLFFPKLAYAEEVARKQDLSPKKARQWIEEVSKAFPGQEATTVFGWLGGVDETKLLSMQFPLAWVESRVVNKTKEEQAKKAQVEDGMDGWRQYARKVIEQGGSNHGVQDREGNLLRIARRVKSSPEEPS